MNNTVEDLQDYFSEEVTYHIDYRDMKALLFKIYAKKVEMIGSANDTTHEFIVRAESSEEGKEEIENALKLGYMDCSQYGAFLNELCEKGYIQEGKYFISVCW